MDYRNGGEGESKNILFLSHCHCPLSVVVDHLP